MNFSVIRNADTYWGRTFAAAFARQKRNLILLGVDYQALIEISTSLSSYAVWVVNFEADDSLDSIIAVCEKINAQYEVDLLLNCPRDFANQKLFDMDIFTLEKRINSDFAGDFYFVHQLLPNLMLHADARIIELVTSDHKDFLLPKTAMDFKSVFSGHLYRELNESDLNVMCCCFTVPELANPAFKEHVFQLELSAALKHLLESNFCGGLMATGICTEFF